MESSFVEVALGTFCEPSVCGARGGILAMSRLSLGFVHLPIGRKELGFSAFNAGHTRTIAWC